MSPLETLQKARDLISDPKRWSQRAFAKDDEGDDCIPTDECAVCFCSDGALIKASGAEFLVGAPEAVEQLLSEAMEDDIWHFNDTHTHAEVLAAFDRAIEKAKASAGAA